VQRRLAETTVDELVHEYIAGSSIDSLAGQLGRHGSWDTSLSNARPAIDAPDRPFDGSGLAETHR
jgi:hypothetical protein